MATFLHDIDALVHLSEDRGIVAMWAREQLVFRAPDAAATVPPCTLGGLLGTQGGARALTLAPPLAGEAALIGAHVGGLDLADPVATDRLRAAFEAESAAHRAPMAWLLAASGHLTAHDALEVAGNAIADHAPLALAALVLATPPGERAALAATIAESVTPQALFTALLMIGPGAIRPVDTDDLRACAHDGAACAGGTISVPKAHGSRKAVTRRIVNTLLDGHTGAAASVARALATCDIAHAALCSTAGWMACFEPTTPIDDVLHRGAGRQPLTLGQARRTAHPNGPDIAAAVVAGMPGAVGLALDHLDGPDDLADRLLDAWSNPDDDQFDLPGPTFAALAAATRRPDRVVRMLRDPEQRILGLQLARSTSTEEVLALLLDLSVPAGADDRHAYAVALAHSGDPVAARRVRQMAQAWPGELIEPLALAAALHGV